MASLHVVIQVDGVRRSFRGEGDDAVVVAAFRAWLAGPDVQLDIAAGADGVEAEASEIEALANLETVWSGTKERAGESPGLAAEGLQSTLGPDRTGEAESENRRWSKKR